jgi:hypothetical protein
MEPLDQGKKTELVHVPEGIGPPKVIICTKGWSDEGVMKMGGRGDVQGVASQATCEEAALVIG